MNIRPEVCRCYDDELRDFFHSFLPSLACKVLTALGESIDDKIANLLKQIILVKYSLLNDRRILLWNMFQELSKEIQYKSVIF